MLRFLWFDSALLDESTMIELCFTCVVFGVSASPFLLNTRIKHHLEKSLGTHSETVTSMLRSIYVDDTVFGAEDEEGTYKLYLECMDFGEWIIQPEEVHHQFSITAR